MTPLRKQSQKGSVLIEFALWIMLLTFLGFGFLIAGLAVQASLIVADAAYEGAHWGANSIYNATNTSGMQQVATNAAKGIFYMTTTASYWCNCSGGSNVSCPTSCGTSADMKYYVQVVATSYLPGIFPGMPSYFTIQGVSVLPVE